jgi:hypothetical protein
VLTCGFPWNMCRRNGTRYREPLAVCAAERSRRRCRGGGEVGVPGTKEQGARGTGPQGEGGDAVVVGADGQGGTTAA